MSHNKYKDIDSSLAVLKTNTFYPSAMKDEILEIKAKNYDKRPRSQDYSRFSSKPNALAANRLLLKLVQTIESKSLVSNSKMVEKQRISDFFLRESRV